MYYYFLYFTCDGIEVKMTQPANGSSNPGNLDPKSRLLTTAGFCYCMM